MYSSPISQRQIWFAAALGLLIAIVLSSCTSVSDNPNRNVPPEGPGPMGGAALTEEQKNSCGITASVTEGPYYVSGMPSLNKEGVLNYTQLPGEPLKISGYVYEGTNRDKALKNAVVDVWQADNDGKYHPNSNGPTSKYVNGELGLRGTVTTNDQGYYEFTTIYPGEYSGRTRHIHVKIRAPGFQELTTQLIVPSKSGDEISFDEDTVSRGLPGCHFLTISGTSPAKASFDFHLEL